VPLPDAVRGLVIRCEYFWAADAGKRVNASQDHPALVIAVNQQQDKTIVAILPITHTRPEPPDTGIALSAATKKAAGLDDAPQWVIVNQGNQIIWPESIRQIPGRPGVFHYGYVPGAAFAIIFEHARQAARKAGFRMIGAKP
jgi:hypothetical protein